ncbi:MAG: C-terminal binding protein [bacterium]|nr:MAG: C-terminal binding protein [bacterium]
MPAFEVTVLSLGYESYDTEREILAPIGAQVVLAPTDCLTEDQVIAAARDADAILVREAPVTERVLENLARCRAVVRYGVGVDNIDLEAARRRRIYVANVPGYGNEEVSDHAAALLLACVRNLLVRDRTLRQGRFETDIRDEVFRTTGKTLGIVGYGAIGRAFLRKWRGFEPGRVLVADPAVSPETAAGDGFLLTGLQTLLEESDYVSLHLPLTPGTRHLIDEGALRKMKPTAILVNTSRGEIIHEEALVRALKEGWILAAGLDVFEKEPLAPDSPLLSLDNVVLSGHVGWYSIDSVRELQTRAAREILRVLTGDVPQCWVNPW